MHRPRLAPGGQPVCQPGQQPVAEGAGRCQIGRDHRCRHARIGQQVAPRHNPVAPGLTQHPQCPVAGEQRAVPVAVHHQQLSPADVRRACRDLCQRRLGPQPAFQQVQQPWPQRRIGDVLAGHNPHPGPRMGAARRHRRRGGRDDDPELPRLGTARGKGEGHGSAFLKRLEPLERTVRLPVSPGSSPWHRFPPASPGGPEPSPRPRSTPDARL